MVVARPCYVFGMAVEPKVRINCYTVINTVTHKLKNVLYAVFSSLPWKASWSRGTSSTCVCGPHTPHSHQHNRFMALFPGPPGRAGARRELLDFMVQGKINRGRHTDHTAGRHSIQTNQCPPPPSPHIFTGRMPFLPPNQQCQSTEGNTAQSQVKL